MPLDRRDPEFPALRTDAHWRLDREFLSGTIGASTYLRSLLLMGIKPNEATQSLRDLNHILGNAHNHEAERLAISKAWMETYRG